MFPQQEKKKEGHSQVHLDFLLSCLSVLFSNIASDFIFFGILLSLTMEPKSLTLAEVKVFHQAAALASAVDQFTSIERHTIIK